MASSLDEEEQATSFKCQNWIVNGINVSLLCGAAMVDGTSAGLVSGQVEQAWLLSGWVLFFHQSIHCGLTL